MLPQIVRDNKPERRDRVDFNDPSVPLCPSFLPPPRETIFAQWNDCCSKVERVIFYERNARIVQKMEYLSCFVDEILTSKMGIKAARYYKIGQYSTFLFFFFF